jgi:hypothetical protein
MGVADTGLVAGDAGADIVDPAVARLGGHLGVRYQRSRHAAGIRLAGDEGLLGDMRLVDAPGDEDGPRDHRADGAGRGADVALLDMHGRDHGCRRGDRLGGPRRDVEIVEAPVTVEGFADLPYLGRAQAHPVHLVARDADTDGHARRARPNRRDHLAEEAQPILEAAAVTVRTAVDPGVEELGDEEAEAGDDLDAVDAPLFEIGRSLAETLDRARDHNLVHRCRRDVKALGRRVRGGVGEGGGAVDRLAQLAPRMEKLGEDGRAVGMAGVGDALVSRHASVAGGHQETGGIAPALLRDRCDLDHDEARTARRPGLVVGRQRRAWRVVREIGVMPREDDPVPKRDRADLKG